MKKTIDLLNEVIDLGFSRETALKGIDDCLDKILGVDEETCSRALPLAEEEIEDSLYKDILNGFIEELEMDESNE